MGWGVGGTNILLPPNKKNAPPPASYVSNIYILALRIYYFTPIVPQMYSACAIFTIDSIYLHTFHSNNSYTLFYNTAHNNYLMLLKWFYIRNKKYLSLTFTHFIFIWIHLSTSKWRSQVRTWVTYLAGASADNNRTGLRFQAPSWRIGSSN